MTKTPRANQYEGLIREGTELTRTFGSILQKSEKQTF